MIERFEKFSFAISKISRCWRKLASKELAKYGLKSPHATYLITLYKYPEGITVPEFCEISGKDKSDASRMMGILEEKGLARKNDVDGSLYRGLWVLTEDGKKAAEHVRLRASRAVEVAGKDLTEESREIFYNALGSITSNLNIISKKGIPD